MVANQTSMVIQRAIDLDNRSLTPELAREFLRWQISDDDSRRMDELTEKSRTDGLASEEMEEFKEFCVAVDLLSILHVYAREALGQLPHPGK